MCSKFTTHSIHSKPVQFFFKIARKCGVFGISCEVTSIQMNYLIDETDEIGKGANGTVSLIHHYLQTHGNNCVGQNKNDIVVQYLAWRIIAGLNDTAELSFMLVGHTKFAPDCFFGLFKRLYRLSLVDTMTDRVRVVKESSSSGKNQAELTVTPLGLREVYWIDWSQFFQHFFKPIPSTTTYHHFKVSKKEPGVFSAREYANSQEVKIAIFK